MNEHVVLAFKKLYSLEEELKVARIHQISVYTNNVSINMFQRSLPALSVFLVS